MNTKTMRKAARDLVPGDVFCYTGGINTRRATIFVERVGGRVVIHSALLGERGGVDQSDAMAADSQFTVEIPAGLTPVQAAADKLLGYAWDYCRGMEDDFPDPLYHANLRNLLDELAPPKPPTLEESVELLRKLAVAKHPENYMPEVSAFLKRVPEA